MSRSSPKPELALSRIPPSRLAKKVAQQILSGIRESGLAPGARVPSERELMSALGVGRSTVREALNGLSMLGVVEVRHGRGVFVANPDLGGVRPDALSLALARGVTRDLFEARRLIEPEAARLAADRGTDSDIRGIGDALADHGEAIGGGGSTVEPAVRFHLRIADAAHNEVLAELIGAFGEPLAERGPALEAVDGYRAWELSEHQALFELIVAGDAPGAARRMRDHLDAVVEHHERVGLS